MSFYNINLPDAFEYGSAFGAGFATLIQETASGHELRLARQSRGRHRTEPGKRLQSSAAAAELKRFALGMRGSLHSFRVKDWQDYTSNADGTTAPTNVDQTLGSGDGSRKDFQLLKTYPLTGGDPYQRTITLPVTGTVVVAIDGVNQASGWTVSSTTGVVTFTAAPTAGQVVTAGYRFDVPMRFSQTVDQWAALRVDAYNAWSLPSLGCIEVLDEVEWPAQWNPGGAKDHGAISSDVSLAIAEGELQRFTPSVAINAFLPAPDWLPGGPRVFVIAVASGAAGSVQLRDDAGVAVGAAITAAQVKQVGVLVAGGTATWVVY